MIRRIIENEIEYINTLSEYKITINDFSNIYIFENNVTKGFIDFSTIYDRIELNYIFVKEEYRNKNIGQKLLNIMLEHNMSITLEVSVLNENAINFYKKNNFKTISIRKNYYKGVDALLMIKEVK